MCICVFSLSSPTTCLLLSARGLRPHGALDALHSVPQARVKQCEVLIERRAHPHVDAILGAQLGQDHGGDHCRELFLVVRVHDGPERSGGIGRGKAIFMSECAGKGLIVPMTYVPIRRSGAIHNVLVTASLA